MSPRNRSVAVLVASFVAVISVSACQPAGETVTASKPPVRPVGVATRHHPAPAPGRGPARRTRHSSPRGDVLVAGVVLPNRHVTPGAVNPAVTQGTIRSTICRTGYTATIRPPSTYTTSLKLQQLGSGYAFRGDHALRDYEEDHLIALELGGAPSDQRNLWPEPYTPASGAKTKDLVENELHDLVCAGRLSLRVAQHAIATNWWRAYQRFGGRAVPEVYVGHFGAAKASTSTNGTSAVGATARCVDGTLSYSTHRSGTCSHHGGVAQWINPPPS